MDVKKLQNLLNISWIIGATMGAILYAFHDLRFISFLLLGFFMSLVWGLISAFLVKDYL